MRRLIGLDLNGRYDMAARDWAADGENETDRSPTNVRLIRGGTAAFVVTTLDGRRVAGPQAELAPHGRGDGWGTLVGEAGRRRPLAVAVDRQGIGADAALDLRAARDALARSAEAIVAAAPDHPAFGESAQAGLIAALSLARSPARLLWRPVALFLDLLAQGLIAPTDLNRRFRLLVHVGAGIEDQTLTLRADPDHPGHSAPQRDGPGQLRPVLGLDGLFDLASGLVHAANPHLPWARCEPSRLGPRLITGEVADDTTEVLRNRNGGWLLARAPALSAGALGLTGAVLPAPEAPVAATFLCTPLAPDLAGKLAEALAGSLGPVITVGPDCVARGCLRAGRLIERGLPHYYDRLEPVAIAILRGQEPVFAHLIPPDAVVPANREHVSPELGGFVWGRGKQATEFYVLKGSNEVRHWRAEKDSAPGQDVPVSLRIRQTPGQSWARLAITSPQWDPLIRSPIALDWETLAPLDLSPEQVLDKLRRQPPPVPNIIVEAAHIDIWMGNYWAGNGLAAALARNELSGLPGSATRWAAELRRPRRHPDPPRERFWLVGTDGSLPARLPGDIRQGFAQALERLAAEAAAATLRRPPRDNDLLATLTWCFARCPEAVQDRILDALDAHASGRLHPLLVPPHAIRVLRQGAGRAVTGVERLTRLIACLDRTELNTDTLNALAMALSRREEAPGALNRPLVDRFLDRLGAELIDRVAARDFKIRFRNTLSAIAGLFRWRRREPFALLAAQDPVAARLRQALVRAQGLLENRDVPQREQKLHQIAAIIDYLDGQGDPDILRLLETDDDE